MSTEKEEQKFNNKFKKYIFQTLSIFLWQKPNTFFVYFSPLLFSFSLSKTNIKLHKSYVLILKQ